MPNYYELYRGSCLDVIPSLMSKDCIFADPFDNLGLKYNGFKDKMPHADYMCFLRECLYVFAETAPTVWFSFYYAYTIEFGEIAAKFLRDKPEWEAKPAVQVFTFGQHQHRDLGNNHRPLWRFKHKDAPLYPDQIRVQSWRQRNGDKRADPRGRVPGDVQDFQYPIDLEPIDWNLILNELPSLDNFNYPHGAYVELEKARDRYGEDMPGSVFDFPRVTGNSGQRCDWHPTQLHEDMLERVVKLSTKVNGTVADAFGGTGTTLRVCKRINRDCALVEKSDAFCEKIAEENDLKTMDVLGPESARWGLVA